MKNFTLSLLVLLPFLGFGQSTDLFFSEYGEGNASNKYYEIYNGTGGPVDLSLYKVILYANGATTATATLTLVGTLQNNTTYVVANSSADPMIINLSDTVHSTCNFNGDDALELVKNGTVLDVFGTVGTDPGSSWTVAGEATAALDHVLNRKASVCSPTTDWTVSAGTDATDSQWEINAIPFNSALNMPLVIGDVGSHTSNCANPCPTLTPPNAADKTICENSSAELTATSSQTGSTFTWYTVAMGGSAIHTGDTFNTPNLTGSTTYYVQDSISGCPASARTEVVVTVSGTAPVVDGGNDQQVCAGTSVTLAATGALTYTWNNGVINNVGFVPTSTETYIVKGTNLDGCYAYDTVVVIVNAVPLVTITANDTVLTASLVDVDYQWYDCANNSAINGENSQSYTLTQNGSYKVEVTDTNGCVAMSACMTVANLSVKSATELNSFKLSPNPTKGKVTITSLGNETANVVIFNALGKEVSKVGNIQNGSVIDFSAFNNGVYMVQITSNKGTKVQRVVKN